MIKYICLVLFATCFSTVVGQNEADLIQSFPNARHATIAIPTDPTRTKLSNWLPNFVTKGEGIILPPGLLVVYAVGATINTVDEVLVDFGGRLFKPSGDFTRAPKYKHELLEFDSQSAEEKNKLIALAVKTFKTKFSTRLKEDQYAGINKIMKEVTYKKVMILSHPAKLYEINTETQRRVTRDEQYESVAIFLEK